MKRYLALILALLMVACLFTACGQDGSNTDDNTDDASASNPDAFTVTDAMERDITFDKQPETFVVANYIFNFLLVGGEESLDQVVGLTKDGWEDTRYGEYTVLTDAFPVIEDIRSIGGYHDDVLDTELILELQPDCLLIARSQYTENETSIPIWEKAGIKVVVLDYHKMLLENHLNSTELIGNLLGREAVAAELCDAYKKGIDEVQKRIATLSEEEKDISVYVELGNVGTGELGNSYSGTLWGAIVDNLGANNIANGTLPEGYGPLDLEYVLDQNPDRIIIGGAIWSGDTAGDQMRMGFTIDEAMAQERLAGFAARPQWKNLTAIADGEVYGVDHGSLRNMLDYTFTEYLAKIIYPELFADLDPAAEYEQMLQKYLPELTGDRTFMIQLEP